jgi:nucleoside-diphosphate-sugar epimerase
MRVLLLGATGNLGSRILPALINRGHTVCAFVRDPSKLAPGVKAELFQLERGDATKAAEIKAAVTRHQCDAIVNAAGYAAMKPWGKSMLPAIVDAVIRAALEVGEERGTPLRLWVLAGQGLMDIPTQKYMLVD